MKSHEITAISTASRRPSPFRRSLGVQKLLRFVQDQLCHATNRQRHVVLTQRLGDGLLCNMCIYI